ncbi:unnamed protein product [Cochlearia groenlandica]
MSRRFLFELGADELGIGSWALRDDELASREWSRRAGEQMSSEVANWGADELGGCELRSRRADELGSRRARVRSWELRRAGELGANELGVGEQESRRAGELANWGPDELELGAEGCEFGVGADEFKVSEQGADELGVGEQKANKLANWELSVGELGAD